MSRFAERQIARAGSYVSRTLAAVPPVGNKVLGSEYPYFKLVGYRLARNRVASTDPADWAEFKGDRMAGLLQRDYRKVGVVLGQAAILDELTEADADLHRAVGWHSDGSDSILVGPVPHRRWDYLDDQGNYRVGMRIGKGVLHVAMGIWDAQSNEFAIPDHASSQGDIRKYSGPIHTWRYVTDVTSTVTAQI